MAAKKKKKAQKKNKKTVARKKPSKKKSTANLKNKSKTRKVSVKAGKPKTAKRKKAAKKAAKKNSLNGMRLTAKQTFHIYDAQIYATLNNHYCLVSASTPEDLVREVQLLMNKGFEPEGGVTCMDHRFYQTMKTDD